MIEIKNLCAGYGKEEVLKSLDIKFEKGKITTVIGTNGCGKTTLLKAIAGIIPVNSGDILIDGRNKSEFKGTELSKELAYLPQSRNIPDITVKNMVLHGRFPYLSYPRRYSDSDIEITEASMKKMGIESIQNKLLTELSGGTRQKVYIAMALAQGSHTLLLDEPTSFLDIAFVFKFMEILKELKENGKTIITVIHDLQSAFMISDFIAVMEDGCIKDYGTPDEIIERGIADKVFGIDLSLVVKR